MIWTQVVCDMTRCGNYLDDIPEGEPIIAYIKARYTDDQLRAMLARQYKGD